MLKTLDSRSQLILRSSLALRVRDEVLDRLGLDHSILNAPRTRGNTLARGALYASMRAFRGPAGSSLSMQEIAEACDREHHTALYWPIQQFEISAGRPVQAWTLKD